MKLSIIIPAYNEEFRLRNMLEPFAQHFESKYGSDVELIVIANGCDDRTYDVASEIATKFSQIRTLNEPRKVGKGAAVVMGMRHAVGDYIGFVDADGATDAEAFDLLYEQAKGLDGAIATRWHKESVVELPQKKIRLISSRIFNLMTRVLFDLKYTDTQCGAKIFKREALAKVLPKLGITRWAFDVDMLFHFRRNKSLVREFPTVWKDAEGSKVEVSKVALDMAAALVRLRLIYSPFRGIVRLYDHFLMPVIAPPGMESDGLFRHSLLLMAAAQVANACNMLFQLFAMRFLPDSDYAVLGAMLSVFGFGCIALGAVRKSVSQFAATYDNSGDRTSIKYMVQSLMLDGTLFSIVLLILLSFGSTHLIGFFQLDDVVPLLFVYLSLFIVLVSGISTGVLFGMQCFRQTTIGSISQAGSRFLLFLIFISMAWMKFPALVAHSISYILAAFISLLFLFRLNWSEGGQNTFRRKPFYSYMGRFLLPWISFAILMNLDIIMAKHYFTPNEAGVFAKIVSLARMVIFLPLPVAGALFPKVVSNEKPSGKARRTLVKGVILVCMIVFSAAIAITLLAPLLLPLVNIDYSSHGGFFIIMVWALIPLSFIFLFLNYLEIYIILSNMGGNPAIRMCEITDALSEFQILAYF